MKNSIKKIAILTSGGDAPGMNACVRACTRYALNQGLEVFGVERGYKGLIDNTIIPMNSRSVSDIIQRGGTVLKTARCPEFLTEEGIKLAAKNLSNLGIDCVITIGGDGSFRGAKDLCTLTDIKVIGIPGTIDNDLAYTDYTLGFDTAVNTVIWAINSLRDTMTSHDRVSLLEVMGRRCGDIALYAGVSGGAEYVLVPEMPYDLDAIANEIALSYQRGKTSNMIILAEGAGDADEICDKIKEKSGISIRVTRLGHIQRGGAPTVADRVLAAKLAVRAVDLIVKGQSNRVVGIKNNIINDMDIDEALSMKRIFDTRLYDIAHILSL